MVKAAVGVGDGIEAPSLRRGTEVVDGEESRAVENLGVAVNDIRDALHGGEENISIHGGGMAKETPIPAVALRADIAGHIHAAGIHRRGVLRGAPDQAVGGASLARHGYGEFQILDLASFDIDAPDAMRRADLGGGIGEAEEIVPAIHDDVGKPSGINAERRVLQLQIDVGLQDVITFDRIVPAPVHFIGERLGAEELARQDIENLMFAAFLGEPVGVAVVPLHRVEGLARGFEMPNTLAGMAGGQADQTEANGRLRDIVVTAAAFENAGGAVRQRTKHGGIIMGQSIVSDPKCFSGEFVEPTQIIPGIGFALRVPDIAGFHIDQGVAREKGFELFVERALLRGAPFAEPNLVTGEIPAANRAAGIEEPDVLAVGDGAGGGGITEAVCIGAVHRTRQINGPKDFAGRGVEAVAHNFVALLFLGVGGQRFHRRQEEAVAPEGDATLAFLGQGGAPDDVLVEGDTPMQGNIGGGDHPGTVGAGGLGPGVGAECGNE